MTAVKNQSPIRSPVDAPQQVAVVRRLKELFSQQRERLYGYHDVLEKQRSVIESGSLAQSSIEYILAYIEIEESIVADILSIQKAIDPLEKMYRSYPVEDGVSALKAELEGLKNQAATESRRNRDMLSARMADIRREIATVRSTSLAMGGRSLYQNVGTASVIDIEG